MGAPGGGAAAAYSESGHERSNSGRQTALCCKIVLGIILSNSPFSNQICGNRKATYWGIDTPPTVVVFCAAEV